MTDQEFQLVLALVKNAKQSQVQRLNQALAQRQEDLNFDLFERIKWIPELECAA